MINSILHGFPDAKPARAVRVFAARQFAQAIGGLLGGGDHGTTAIDDQPSERIANADLRQMICLVQKRVGFDQHEAGEDRPHAGHE